MKLTAFFIASLSACAWAIVIPASSKAGSIPAQPGTGVGSTVWFGGVNTSADALAFTQANAAAGTFFSTSIDYPRGSSGSTSDGTLAEFLADDGASANFDLTRSVFSNIFIFDGFLAFREAGEHSFGVGSDDGFILTIGGVLIGSGNDRPVGFSWFSLEVAEPGLYPFNLLYYANSNGLSGVEIAQDLAAGGRSVATADLYSQVPGPGVVVGAAALAGLTALRRRRR